MNQYFHYCVSVNDTLDDILTESGDEEEEDAIVTQVLDEIGIDISGKVWHIVTQVLDEVGIDISGKVWQIVTQVLDEIDIDISGKGMANSNTGVR